MRFIFILLIFCIPAILQAQRYSGLWYGRAEANTSQTYNTYLCEFNIIKKGNQISGSLSYFFGKDEYRTKISGIFHPSTKTIELNPFKLITYFAGDKNAPDCEMDGSLTLYIHEGDSVLYGQLNPTSKYRNGCPVMTISLHKETIANEAPLSVTETVMVKPDTLLKSTPDPVAYAEVVPTHMDSSVTAPPVVVQALNKRTFVEGPLLEVAADTITLHLYDNGKVDHDTVTVFFNRMPVVEKKPLSLKPIIIKLALAPGVNEVALFAENLGEIPPNTALCIVYAGQRRYDINLSSSMATNGTIRITRKE